MRETSISFGLEDVFFKFSFISIDCFKQTNTESLNVYKSK